MIAHPFVEELLEQLHRIERDQGRRPAYLRAGDAPNFYVVFPANEPGRMVLVVPAPIIDGIADAIREADGAGYSVDVHPPHLAEGERPTHLFGYELRDPTRKDPTR